MAYEGYMPRATKANIPIPNTSTNYRHHTANYYSGSDIRIFFGDIWVDEITNIDFTLVEQVAPIFGYASYTWDRVARGNRYVQGQFSINFKETGYLQMVLNSLSSDIEKDPNTGYFNKAEYEKEMTIEALLKQKNQDFHELADDLEASFWGEGNKTDYVQKHEKTTFFYPNIGGVNGEYGDLSFNQNNLHEHGFNIVITYGGVCMDGRANDSHETVQTIMGVQLTSVGQQVGPDGQPIQEVYQFIARDLQGDVRYRG